VALDNHGTFLAMERSYASGLGNTIVLFETSIQGATDVSGIDALGWEDCPEGDDIIPMSKTYVVDLGGDLGTDLDNMEGMTFGPPLPDGRLPLIIVSDNNFGTNQKTLFIALAVELIPVSK
jgi:3-phytase